MTQDDGTTGATGGGTPAGESRAGSPTGVHAPALVTPPGRASASPPPVPQHAVPGAPDFVVPLDAQRAIAADVVCRKCAYNLRGLREDGVCPECGSPVGLSTHGDLLRFADPDWVETLARGLTFILWGILVAVIASVVSTAISARVHPVIGGMIGFVGSLLGYYGAWLLTERDPSGLGEDRYGTARRIVRIALLIGLCGSLASVVFSRAPGAGGLPLAVAIVLLATTVIYVIGEFAKYYYLEKLAQRIPDPRLAGRARFLRWALAVCYLIVGVGGTAAGITAAARPAGPGQMTRGQGALIAFGCVAVAAFLCLIVFYLMAILLQYRMRNVVREHALFARDAWRAAAHSP